MFERILEDFNATSPEEALLRVALAGLLGFLIGLDREAKHKPIDFRAYMLVAITSCLMAIAAQELKFRHGPEEGFLIMDLGKVIAGTLTGIGFLGAGAIIKRGDRIVGTATGASIWASGGLGVVLGFGYYGLGLLGGITILVILIIFGLIRGTLIGGKEFEADHKGPD